MALRSFVPISLCCLVGVACLPLQAQQAEKKPTAAPPAAATQPAPAAAGELELTALDGGTAFSLVALNAEAKAVFEQLARESGWEIRAEPAPTAKVTLTLNNESFERTLAAVARAIGYQTTRVYVLSPRKEGQELPDPFRMPLELPSVSLQLTKPVPVADAVAALGNAARVPIEAAPALKGEATIDAAETPLAEALNALCEQVEAVWTISYRLKPTPKQAPAAGAAGGTGNQDDGFAAEARREMEQWAKMTPAQRTQQARRQMSDLLRADPAERKRELQKLTGQLGRLGRALNSMEAEDRQQLAKMLQDRATPYLSELRQMTPEQQREFAQAAAALRRVIAVAKQPPPKPATAPAAPAPGGKPAPRR